MRINALFGRKYGFLIILVSLFAISIVGQFAAQALAVGNAAAVHGQPFSWDRFWPQFLGMTLATWQATFLQLLILVALATYLLRALRKRDTDEALHKRLQRIEGQLALLNNQWAPRVKSRQSPYQRSSSSE